MGCLSLDDGVVERQEGVRAVVEGVYRDARSKLAGAAELAASLVEGALGLDDLGHMGSDRE